MYTLVWVVVVGGGVVWEEAFLLTWLQSPAWRQKPIQRWSRAEETLGGYWSDTSWPELQIPTKKYKPINNNNNISTDFDHGVAILIFFPKSKTTIIKQAIFTRTLQATISITHKQKELFVAWEMFVGVVYKPLNPHLDPYIPQIIRFANTLCIYMYDLWPELKGERLGQEKGHERRKKLW